MGPEARFLLHEAVLHQRLPGVKASVHTAQFKHLLEILDLPNVAIRIFPLASAAHNIRGVTSGFTILEMHDSWPTLLHVETPAGAVVAETPDIDSFTGVYDQLWQDALDEKQTSNYLSRQLKEVEQ